MTSRRNVQYSRLPTDEDYEYDGSGKRNDPRFDYSPKSFDRIPWKSISLALFLLTLGCVLLFLSYFIFTGHMGGEVPQAYGLLALGFLTFLPENGHIKKGKMGELLFLGFYETRIAYYAWRGARGYRFALIPNY